MPYHRQMIFLTFLGLLLAGLLVLHTLPGIVVPGTRETAEEQPDAAKPVVALKVPWSAPGSALEGRFEADRDRIANVEIPPGLRDEEEKDGDAGGVDGER